MQKMIGEMLKKVLPDVRTKKYTKEIYAVRDEILESVGHLEVPPRALEGGRKLIPRTKHIAPDYGEHLKKYGYLPPIHNEYRYVVEKALNKRLTEELVEKLLMETKVHKAYNIFLEFGNLPPVLTAKPIEELIQTITNQYTTATKPIDLDDTPANRYDIYLPEKNLRVEVKGSRLIDRRKNGPMKERMSPFGAPGLFSTDMKQVKIRYFDALVYTIIASNVIVYALFTGDRIEEIIYKSFINSEIPGVYTSTIHNTEKVPQSKEERQKLIHSAEFRIAFYTYKAMKELFKYAEIVTTDVQKLAKKLASL